MIQIKKRTTPIFIIILLLTVSTISVNAGVIKLKTVGTLNEGSIIYVDDDNTEGPWDGTQEHPYQYIQDGVNATDNGDTVFVYNGLYMEWIRINKEIELNGEDKTNTIIDVEREGG